jgi:hypothetical protein
MNAGTTNHEFLKTNLEWLSKATNWAKFSATASLGVIHKVSSVTQSGFFGMLLAKNLLLSDFFSFFFSVAQGHLSQSMNVLQPYLPQQGVTSTAGYQEGGALYGLGLIHANHGKDIIGYLSENLKATQNEIIQHGACLGLGVAAMATDSDGACFDRLLICFLLCGEWGTKMASGFFFRLPWVLTFALLLGTRCFSRVRGSQGNSFHGQCRCRRGGGSLDGSSEAWNAFGQSD